MRALLPVSDFDAAGNHVPRSPAGTPPVWEYTLLKPGWTHIVASKEKLLFYDRTTGEGMTGYVLTADESYRYWREPLHVSNTYPEGSISAPQVVSFLHVVPVPEVMDGTGQP